MGLKNHTKVVLSQWYKRVWWENWSRQSGLDCTTEAIMGRDNVRHFFRDEWPIIRILICNCLNAKKNWISEFIKIFLNLPDPCSSHQNKQRIFRVHLLKTTHFLYLNLLWRKMFKLSIMKNDFFPWKWRLPCLQNTLAAGTRFL